MHRRQMDLGGPMKVGSPITTLTSSMATSSNQLAANGGQEKPWNHGIHGPPRCLCGNTYRVRGEAPRGEAPPRLPGSPGRGRQPLRCCLIYSVNRRAMGSPILGYCIGRRKSLSGVSGRLIQRLSRKAHVEGHRKPINTTSQSRG